MPVLRTNLLLLLLFFLAAAISAAPHNLRQQYCRNQHSAVTPVDYADHAIVRYHPTCDADADAILSWAKSQRLDVWTASREKRYIDIHMHPQAFQDAVLHARVPWKTATHTDGDSDTGVKAEVMIRDLADAIKHSQQPLQSCRNVTTAAHDTVKELCIDTSSAAGQVKQVSGASSNTSSTTANATTNAINNTTVPADVVPPTTDNGSNATVWNMVVDSTFWSQVMTTYLPLPDILVFLNDLQRTYPALVSLQSIGKSYEGEELVVARVGAQKDNATSAKPKLVVLGAQHAREWISTAVILNMLRAWPLQYGSDPNVTALLDTFDVYILPVANPDGYKTTFATDRLWRKNRQPTSSKDCIGIDQNRNWPLYWSVDTFGASTDPCDDTFKGDAEGDALETAAIVQWLETKAQADNDPWMAMMDLHSYSQLWLSPYGYDCQRQMDDQARVDAAANKAVNALAQVYGTEFTYGSVCQVLYPASGSSIDWAYGHANITYAYGSTGFLLPTSQIWPSFVEFSAGLASLVSTLQSDLASRA
ncbi:hypothetical protein RI367_000807 [Sorochytrium milnesiophthora]